MSQNTNGPDHLNWRSQADLDQPLDDESELDENMEVAPDEKEQIKDVPSYLAIFDVLWDTFQKTNEVEEEPSKQIAAALVAQYSKLGRKDRLALVPSMQELNQLAKVAMLIDPSWCNIYRQSGNVMNAAISNNSKDDDSAIHTMTTEELEAQLATASAILESQPQGDIIQTIIPN